VLPLTGGLLPACNVLASPINKNIFVVRLSRMPAGRQGKVFKFDGRQQALFVARHVPSNAKPQKANK
jgi:hypothetical protein